MQHRRLTVLSLLLAASCATGTKAAPNAPGSSRGCVDAQIVARAAQAAGEGRLLRARGLLQAQRPLDPRCVDPGRAELEATLDRELGDPATLDPFASIDAARTATDPIAAQKSWDRAAIALEVQTGKQGNPLWLDIDYRQSEQVAIAGTIPASLTKRVVYGRRRADGPLEPIRLASSVTVLPGGALITRWGGTVRRVVPEAISDPTLPGVLTNDFLSSTKSPYAVACDRGGLHLYDVRSLEIVGKAARPCNSWSIVASEDRLIIRNDYISVLELPSMRELAQFPVSGFVDHFTLSGDRSTLAVIDGKNEDDHVKVLLLDLRRGVALPSIAHTQAGRLRMALSPNGTKLLLVDEAAEVFDLKTNRRTLLGGRVFHPFRPGSYDRNGWGDLVTPPAGTGAIAVMDDGRACIEQGGTAAVLPRSATEVCSIDDEGVAHLGWVFAASSPTQWSPPPALTNDVDRTVLVDERAELVLRVEQTRDKAARKKVVVAYDRRSGRERRRIALERSDEISLRGLVNDGRSLELWMGGGGRESWAAPFRLDLQSGTLTSTRVPDPPHAPWFQAKVEDGKLVLSEVPGDLHWFWDLHDLRRFGVDEPSYGAIPPIPSLTFVVTTNEWIEVFDKRAGPERIATLVPMRRGLAVFWQSGELELAHVTDLPQDLVCTYGDLVVPLQACGERIVQGSWRRRFGGGAQ